ncbi:MAG: hypothetical protein M5U12_29440 [Verrucomicrobia bacterium]|nr:hypothetical protein [Verrucomicrobiota bacterium]
MLEAAPNDKHKMTAAHAAVACPYCGHDIEFDRNGAGVVSEPRHVLRPAGGAAWLLANMYR